MASKPDRTSAEYREAMREEGRAAYRADPHRERYARWECPYHAGSIEGREWIRGFKNARRADREIAKEFAEAIAPGLLPKLPPAWMGTSAADDPKWVWIAKSTVDEVAPKVAGEERELLVNLFLEIYHRVSSAEKSKDWHRKARGQRFDPWSYLRPPLSQ